MDGMKTRKKEREVEDAGGIVNNEKGIPRFKTLQLASIEEANWPLEKRETSNETKANSWDPIRIPANSMEAPSELVVGQAVQTSAAETKKAKRLWQKMEDTQKQFKKLKANYAKLVKSEASSSVILDRLKNDLEKAREAKRLQEQKVEQQKLMINTLQQLE
ncbi:hypothetical protein NC651_031517 [Populus alba x Populus x berolinensis]|nr:hypothetical protein NC651_031517 [Populus alba x Populus x berolinensis]